ncbi:hypothetical protein KEJ45_05185 [Candidatus Bathyarchaeota archaeon]|nr:hypothetical protein [Candidatus Bathyarchaeota archaeon]
MACFLVPMILAIITSTIQKTARNTAQKLKLWLLNALLWGGVILLTVEHVWHGEVTPWPPYLTAMSNPADIPIMLHEMSTIGTAMSVVTLCTWAATLAISNLITPKITAFKQMGAANKTNTTI